jgi:hypothetical protein
LEGGGDGIKFNNLSSIPSKLVILTSKASLCTNTPGVIIHLVAGLAADQEGRQQLEEVRLYYFESWVHPG